MTRPTSGSAPRPAVAVPSQPRITSQSVPAQSTPAAQAKPDSNFQDQKKKLLSLGKTGTKHAPVPPAGSQGTLSVNQLARQSVAGGATGAVAVKTTVTPPASGHGMKSPSGKISPEQWADPTKLVGKLTQFPAKKDAGDQSQAACSAANLLGAALLTGGPDAAAAMLKKVTSGATQLNAAETTELNGIADRIKNKTATFEDLNKAQQLLYRSANTEATGKDLVDQAVGKLTDPDLKKLEETMKRYTTAGIMSREPKDVETISRLLGKAFKDPNYKWDPDSYGKASVANRRTKDLSGLTDDELSALGKTAAKGETVTIDNSTKLKDLAGSLKPGEAITLRLAGDGAPGTTPNHYVTVGKRPDGSVFIYNPDPSRGDSTLVTGKLDDPKFKAQLTRYEQRMKAERVDRDDGTKTLEYPRANKSTFN